MLKIFTSYTPGAGKSYAMMEEAMNESRNGKKVVIAFINKQHRVPLKCLLNAMKMLLFILLKEERA